MSLGKTKLSLQKRRAYERFSNLIQWGRKNPTLFAEHMFGVKLMDYQKYVFMQTWTKPFNLWLMCRAAGKTALMAVYLMTRLVLIPNYQVFVAGVTGPQAILAFKKLENIALGREPSFSDVSDVFAHELVTGKGGDAFKHGQSEHSLTLYNGSRLATLTSNVDALRGRRGAVWYDEASFIGKGFMDAIDQFAIVDSSFSLKVDDSGYKDPLKMPLQLIYTSSAGYESMPFYNKFYEYSKHMIAGNPNYFVCNIDVDCVLEHTTVDGESVQSHLNEESIRAEIEENPDMADREYFNHFTRGGGRNAIVSGEVLVRNSVSKPPVLFNDTGKRKFILCYDPARNYDNSILSIFELIDDPKMGYMIDLVNVISMVDERKDQKTPLPMPKQLEILRETMIKYNGERAAEWENIELYIDAGAGGGPRSSITDYLLAPWTDAMGVEHRGVIDPVDKQYDADRAEWRDSAPIVHLIEPTKYKAKIFGAFEELSALNLIKYTNYNGYRDFILVEDSSSEEGYKEYYLSTEEKVALSQIELAKTEISCIVRTEHAGTRTVSYELMRERRNKMHDDRAYTLALGAFALWEKRNKDIRVNKNKDKSLLLEWHSPKPYGRRKRRFA